MTNDIKVTLAHKYQGQCPKGMLMSEKLDGVRAVWDGKRFVSRSGKEFHAPDWFIASMPKGVVLDGELWEGRGLFQSTVGKVRSHHGNWDSIKFMIFDVIADGNYQQRMDVAWSQLPSHCTIVEQLKCRSEDHLRDFESGVLALGGEGVMLRDPNAEYEHKRSRSLLKVKRFQSAEAVVIGHQDGMGKHQGRLGALICKLAGKQFAVGTGFSDAVREDPPGIGSIITFSFFELTNAGIPRFPVFCAVRDYE